MKLFKESKSTHYIDVYDKTGEFHRQWPNNAWPPKQHSIQFESGVKQRRKRYTLEGLKVLGVTPATSLRGIGCAYSFT